MKRLLYWIPALLYMAGIFFYSNLPHPPAPGVTEGPDKILHFAEYAILAGLFFWAIKNTWPKMASIFLFLSSWGLASLYGLTDEIHQVLIPPREPRLFDLLADIAGAAFMALVLSWVRKRKEPRAKNLK